MDDFFVKRTFNTPEVELKPAEGILKIEGRSIPEDPGEYYDIILQKLEDYYRSPQKITNIEIKLEYINSGSSKYMLELFRIVKQNYEKGSDCIVNWFYEEDDESILELGQHYQNTIKIPFKMVGYY
jgi:hypothetical protein